MKDDNMLLFVQKFISLLEKECVEPQARRVPKYEWLQLRTGIPARRWQNVVNGATLPTSEMIFRFSRCLDDNQLLSLFRIAEFSESMSDDVARGYARWQWDTAQRKLSNGDVEKST